MARVFTTKLGSTHELRLNITQNSQSISGNSSVIGYNFYIQRVASNSGGYWSNNTSRANLTINGTKILNNAAFTYDFSSNYTKTLKKGTMTVGHNSDGSKTVSASGSIDAAGLLPSGSGSGSFGLTKIPRASSFTLSGGTKTGSSINVSITRATSSFTHVVRYKVGRGGWKSVSSSAGTSASFSIPHTDITVDGSATITVGVQTKSGSTNIGSEVTRTRTVYGPKRSTFSVSGTTTGSATTISISPDNSSFRHEVWYRVTTEANTWVEVSSSAATSATFTVPHSSIKTDSSGTVEIWVRTKTGNTWLGKERTTTVKYIVPELNPVINSVSIVESNSAISSLNLSAGSYVESLSNVRVSITSHSLAHGAAIEKLEIRSVSHSSPETSTSSTTLVKDLPTSMLLSHHESLIMRILDARGNYSEYFEVPITVESYQTPGLQDVTLYRSTSAGALDYFGESVYMKLVPSLSSLQGKNQAKITIGIRSSTPSYMEPYTNESVPSSGITDIFHNMDQSTTYQFEVVVSDKLTESRTLDGSSLFIGTGGANFFVGSNGVASSAGKVPEWGATYDMEIGPKGMHMAGDLKMSTGTTIDGHYGSFSTFSANEGGISELTTTVSTDFIPGVGKHNLTDRVLPFGGEVYYNSSRLNSSDVNPVYESTMAVKNTGLHLGSGTLLPSAVKEVLSSIPDRDWTNIPLKNGFLAYSVDGTPKYRVKSGILEVSGAVKPPSNNTVGTGGGQVFGTLPYTPAQYGVVHICQGSGTDKWLLRFERNGDLRAERYHKDAGTYVTPPTSAWMVFQFTTILD